LTNRLFLVCVGVFIFCGYAYLFIALKVRCPQCGFKFLKNPKGLGPTGFVYHLSCPKKTGLNPWAVQIGRFLAIHRIRCINCGQEVFE
jgi:DNA-directed RNA polymerase subunit RPC12/RpoP